MPVRRSSAHLSRSPRGAPSRSTASAARRFVRSGTLATLLVCGGAVLITGPERTPALPRCDSSAVAGALGARLDDIPAFTGRGATLIGLDDVRRRGHAGRRSLRACQGRVVTSVGSGPLEYSIRARGGGAFGVRPELFQGGWRARPLDTPETRAAGMTRGAPDDPRFTAPRRAATRHDG